MYAKLLRRSSFVFLWAAQIASSFAVQLYKIGVVVVIFEQTGSTLQAAGVLVATSLPYVLIGQVAGALVDRYSRKAILVGVALAQALLVGLSALLSGATLNVWLIYAVVAGLSLTDAFYKPALLAIVPAVVDKPTLVHANSLIHSTNYAVLALGYGIGGILILELGLPVVVAINLVLFLLSAFFATRVEAAAAATAKPARKKAEPIWPAVRAGLSYLRRHDLARSLITMEFLEHWPHAIWTAALMLAFTLEGLGVGEEFFGYQNAVYFGSNLLGAALAVAFASRLGKRPGWVIISNALVMAALTIVYALTSDIWLAMLVMLLYGLPQALRDVAQDSLLQAAVDPAVLGRVYATRQMLAHLAFMVSGLLLAALADWVAIRSVYLLGAGLYLLTALYALSRPALRKASVAAPQVPTLGDPVP